MGHTRVSAALRVAALATVVAGAACSKPPPVQEPADPPGSPLAPDDVARRKHLVVSGLSPALAKAVGRELSRPPDRIGALAGYALACEQGERAGCVLLSLLDRTAPERVEAKQSLVWGPLENGCRSDVAAACHLLGLAQDDDAGQPVDQSAALNNFLRACDLGFAVSCPRAAAIYKHGPRATEKDAPKLLRSMLAKACNSGIPAGCRSYRQLGVEADDLKACTLGDLALCVALLQTPRRAGAKRVLEEQAPEIDRLCKHTEHLALCMLSAEIDRALQIGGQRGDGLTPR